MTDDRRQPTFEVVRGDITRIPADAIVNAANSSLAGGGGVDGAIHRAGGPGVMADLDGPYGHGRHCPTGSAVVSLAGRRPAKWVIHAVGPVWHDGRHGEDRMLAAAYSTAIRPAHELGAMSITFPAISCGTYGYPVADGAPVAVAAVRAGLEAASTLRTATFVLLSEDARGAFQEAITAG